jgi:hypothetical protein
MITNQTFVNVVNGFQESYITQGNLNIRIHRDITGEMWFGVG